MKGSYGTGSMRPNSSHFLPEPAWTSSTRTGVINTIETTESHVGRPGFWGWIFNAAWLSDFLPRILTAAIFVPVVLLLLWIGPTLLSNFFVAV